MFDVITRIENEFSLFFPVCKKNGVIINFQKVVKSSHHFAYFFTPSMNVNVSTVIKFCRAQLDDNILTAHYNVLKWKCLTRIHLKRYSFESTQTVSRAIFIWAPCKTTSLGMLKNVKVHKWYYSWIMTSLVWCRWMQFFLKSKFMFKSALKTLE